MSIIKRVLLLVICFAVSSSFINLPIVKSVAATSDTAVQYRYRDKEYCSSYIELEEPWVLYNTGVEYTHSQYEYMYLLYYAESGTGAGNGGYTDYSSDQWKYNNSSNYCFHGSKILVYKYCRKMGYSSSTGPEYIYATDSTDVDLSVYYPSGNRYWRFQICTNKIENPLYYYYKWGDWSEWSENEVVATDSREVETQVVHEHSYSPVITPPTCTTQGYTTYTCDSCKDSYISDYVDVLSHKYNQVVIAPSCTEQGYTTYTCDNCNESYTSEYIDALGHKYYTVVTTPTCTTQGYTTYVCDNCSNTYIDNYCEAIDHTYNPVATAPTCTEQGSTTYTCSSCGGSYTSDYTDALGHCYDNGVCIVCGDVDETISDQAIPEGLVYTVCEDYVVITDYTGSGTEIIIPATIEGFPVVQIGEGAFSFRQKITSIVIPDSVTTIGADAFYFCMGLESIVIPDSVTRIGELAFDCCESLTYNIFDNGKYLGNSENPYVVLVASTSQSITTCEIHPNTKVVGSYAFLSNSNLKSITISNSVTDIGDSAFLKCTSLASITIPNSVISIGELAFSQCHSMSSISVPDSVTSIGDYAFLDCNNLTGIWVDKNNVNYSNDMYGGLYNKERTVLIQAPDKIYGSYIIIDGVTSIGNSAFQYSGGLDSIAIPDSVISIGISAFYRCSGLSKIYYCGTFEQWGEISIEENNSYLINTTKYYHDYVECFVPCTICGYVQEHEFANGLCIVCDQLESYYWTLSANADATITLERDLYVDLNGYVLSGTIISNSYKIYGMDSTTDGYTCSNMGCFNCVDENGNAIVPETHCKSDLSGSVKRYMAIETEDGYTFHRFYLGITNVSLAPNVTGFGYKAEFYGDEMVQQQIASIGYNLWMTENCVVSRTTAFKNTLTLRLQNFDIDNYGETPINASVCIILTDGTMIESSVTSMSMRNMLESINAQYDSYSDVQRSAVKAMIEKYAIIKSWDTKNLFAYH